MGVLYLTLLLTYISAFISRISKNRKVLSIFYCFLVFGIIFLVSALRGDTIGDTFQYKHSYSLLYKYKFSTEGDWGFNLFQYFLYKINKEPQFLIIITSLITVGFNIYNLYHYCSYMELEIYMYITSGYFTTTMNGIRQSMLAAVVFTFTRIIEKENTILFIIAVILASPFHQSVLILIPVYFIVKQEAWSKTTVAVIIVSCIGFMGFSTIFPALLRALEDTNYGYYANQTDMGGSSFMRVIVNAIPVILAYIKRKELKENWPKSNIFVNMALINVIFVAFGMYNWIFNRFTIYFQLYNFVLIPYIIQHCFNGKERRLIYVGFLLCYFIFFYKEQVLSLNINYTSKYLDFNKIFYENVGG